ncbi:MAG: FkbM family methyltransferase [Candidatus Aenigmatarchaeota archaeon]
MRIEFLTLKRLIFYLKTPSPLVSKLKVLYWFLVRAFLRTTIGWKRATQLLKGVENKKIKTKMKDGAQFINTIEQIGNFYEIYGERKQELIKIPLKSNPVIIDIGAHIGIYSIKKALEFPRGKVIAIEPERKNFEMLLRNKKLNKLKNLFAYKIALFSKNGKTKLFLDKFGSGQHSLIGEGCRNFERVLTKKLDNFVKSLNLHEISCIKIDTEGAEFEILKGAKNTIKKYLPLFVIETHPWKIRNNDEKIRNFLKAYGYKLIEFKNKGSIIFALKKKKQEIKIQRRK